MHLARTRLTQHADQSALRVAAHYGIVDNNESLSGDDVTKWVEFEANAQLTNCLGRLNEGAPHVSVLDQSLGEWDARLLGVTDCGVSTRLWNGNHEIGIDRMLTGQLLPDLNSGGLNAPTRDAGIRTG